MKDYTQEELEDLIRCSKRITEAPKREMRLDGNQHRNDMRLESDDGSRHFRAFMRVNEDFAENFSIGLAYDPKDGSGEITLLRCNGPHGPYNDRFDLAHPHSEPHVHRASADAIKAGLPPEKRAERSRDFASYREALVFFLRETNVQNAGDHFPDYRQPDLPFDSGEFSS